MRRAVLRFGLALFVSSVVLGIVCWAAAPAPSTGTTSFELLINDADVQKQLDLTEDQVKDATKACVAVRTRWLAKYKNFKFRVNNDIQAQAMAEEFVGKVNADTEAALAPVLSDEQFKRLKQIDRQQRGLLDNDMAKTLALTAEQRRQMFAVSSAGEKELVEAHRKIDRRDMKKRLAVWQQLRARVADDQLKLLTDKQRQQWDDLTGEAFVEMKFDEFTGIRPRIGLLPQQPPRWGWGHMPLG